LIDLFETYQHLKKDGFISIHFNHANPLIDKTSKEYKDVKSKGFNVAFEGLKVSL